VTPRGDSTSRSGATFAVTGRRAATEAIRAGQVRRLLVANGATENQALRTLLHEAERAQVPVSWVDRTVVAKLGPWDHQGVAALTSLPLRLTERDVAQRSFPSDALVVILDGITDPQNLGACARSAEAAGAELVIVRKDRAAPMTPAAIRASAGALFHIPVAAVTNLVRSMDRLKDQGFTVVGLAADGGSMFEAPPPSGPTALVVGSEGTGLSRLVREHCDLLVSIPMHGRTESLNASAALAVGLFGYAVRT
jgi:23S rRNA (guanosine2251-2'-O)-methyltransferase